MNPCDQYQVYLLDYLYDALEETERQALQQHLGQCSACQAALEQARRHQRLLAQAAKVRFPSVRFEEPSPVIKTASQVAAKPLGRSRSWLGWAVAAAVLGGLGLPAAWLGFEYHRRYQAVKIAEARQAEASRELAELQEADRAAQVRATQEFHQVQEELNQLAQKTQQRLQDILNQQLQILVTGPAHVQAGAPNNYTVQTCNAGLQPVPASVTARVVNHKQEILYEEKVERSRGVIRLELPPTLPLKPDTDLFLEIEARRDDGASDRLRERLDLSPPVYVTHLATDKPLYRPGETVYFRSLTLERFSLKPAEETLQLVYTLTAPNGQQTVVTQGTAGYFRQPDGSPFPVQDTKLLAGIGCGSWTIDAGAPGGEYTLTVRELSDRFPEQSRKFLVNQYENPRLNKELEFTRKSYGPGDEVVAACKVSRTEGGAPVARRPVLATVIVDGKETEQLSLQTDEQGLVNVRFKLPARIERGEASLSVRLDDGGSIETLVRPIPIVLKKLNIEFFPEGGDLVAGIPNRCYFQARTTLGKPAELRGRLVDDQGEVAAVSVQTFNDDAQPGANQGMGVFTFIPRPNRTYELQIDNPTGIEGRYVLPAVKADGVVLHVPRGVVPAGQPIPIRLTSAGKQRRLHVGAYCRGRLLDSRAVTVGAGAAVELELKPNLAAGGVCRITVFEEVSGSARLPLKPVAERLLYRQSGERLNITVHPDRKQYVPGEHCTLTLKATDEKDHPAQAVFVGACVDRGVLNLADEKTARAMPTHFLLTTEVRRPEDLEHADFLLGEHPSAAVALDLLLGTQGWRRFAEQDPQRFRQRFSSDAERLLVLSGQGTELTRTLTQTALDKVQKEVQAEQTRLQDRLAAAAQVLAKPHAGNAQAAEIERLQAEIRDAQAQRLAAAGALQNLLDLARVVLLPLAVGLLVLAIVGGVVVGLRVNWVQALQTFGTAAVCTVALLLGVSLFLVESNAPLSPATSAPMKSNLEIAARLPVPEAQAPLAAQAGIAGVPKDGAKAFMFRMAEPAQDRARLQPAAPAEQARHQRRARATADNKRLILPPVRPRPADEGGVVRGFNPAAIGGRLAPNMQAAGAVGGQFPADQAFFDLPEAAVAAPQQPFIVREYAHQRTGSAQPELRSDFVDTVWWHPVLVLPNGEAKVSFQLCDSVTSYQIILHGHTPDGRLGATTAVIEARLPFNCEPKLPIEVTASDRIDLPVSVANNTSEARQVALQWSATGLSLLSGQDAQPLVLPAESRGRRIFSVRPTLAEGLARVQIDGSCPPYVDSIVRSIGVVPDGFPIIEARSDMLENSAAQELVLPPTWVPGSLKCQVTAYPSTLASLQKGLESLLREPCGCFEQTSTSNYPNVLILEYLKETDQVKPDLERRARELLTRGYNQLISFECLNESAQQREGYEWFGGTAPPHEALTAYGLMQFRDMARVHDVDSAMLERTRKFLLSRKDGRGGFQRNPRALDTFGRAPEDITNAYIVWAITEGGQEDNVEQELDALKKQAQGSKDPYFLALVANSLLNRGHAADGVALLKKLVAAQKADGYLEAERTSITGSGGRDLQIETTALTILAWLKSNQPEYLPNIQKAIKWIGQQRGGYGGFGSTQSTILALKALIAYAKANKKTVEAGEVRLLVSGQPVASRAFPAGVDEALVLDLPEPEKILKPGPNQLRLELTGKNTFPYTLSCSYRTVQPPSAANCALRLMTRLDRQAANEGDTVRLSVRLENVSGKGQGMAVAVVGLPGGLSLPEDLKQLKEHAKLRNDGTERGPIDSFEVRGRELVLYWRDLAPGKVVEVPVDLVCRVPGEYRGPASRAYLYYNADAKHWIEPLSMTIKPKAE